MAQQSPASDETVRMRPDDSAGRPPLDGPHTAVREDLDDTRPVTRDWLLGAPDAGQAGLPAEPDHTASPAGDTAPATDVPTPEAAGAADAPEPALAETGPLTGGDDTGSDTPEGPPPPGAPPAGSPRGRWWRRRAVLAPVGALVLLGAAYGVDLLVSSGDIPRHTVVAGVDIGGLSPAKAATTLERDLAPRVAADHAVVADDVQATLSPAAAGLALDVDGTVDAADDQPLNPWTRLVTLFSDRTVDPVLSTDHTALDAQLETIAEQVDRAPADATIAIEGTTASVVPPADGRKLDREGAADAIAAALTSGADPETPIDLPVDVAPVHVDADEAQRVLDETVTPALSAPVSINSQDGATHTEIPVTAIAGSLTFTPQEDGTLAVAVDPAALQTAMGDEFSRFGIPAEDARFEISGGSVSVVPSVDGTGIDPTHLAEQLLPVLTDPAPRSVTADLGPVPADFTTEEAQALGIKEEISSFTTHFTSTASGTNIRVVAAEVDGALVKPGETFSLNTFTGPRGTAQGYVEAAVISGGQLSKAVGGGISQFATTMFNAVFFAGLEDVHHKPHSFYISRYPAGREATVYEGVIDLQWRNDGDTGVYVDTSWSPGSITVTFYGTKRYEIEAIEGPRTNHRQPAVQDKVDDGNCTPQSGVPGFDVTVTRVFRDLNTGAEIRRENFNTHYAAEAVIHCVPPAGSSPPGQDGTTPAGGPSPGGRRPRPGVRRVR
jgi:vancomycin resistance protein YoaR